MSPPPPPWLWPSISSNSISLPPVFTSRACQGRNDSHEVVLGLIKTCQRSAPLGASHDTHVRSPHIPACPCAAQHPHIHQEGVRKAGQLTWPPEGGDWCTWRGNLRLWAGGKSMGAELKAAGLRGAREATWSLITLFGNQLQMSFLESISMFWSWWNPLGVYQYREVAPPSVGADRMSAC